MSVRLADVIDVLDQAYPPRLAQSWDSVGLVCGDPDDVVDSVTVAVDATPAVVDQVPQAGLLLVHHPLLLRGVDTVAANTPKGVLVHRLIRTGRSLFTAHTNADSASPGVSDALAHAVGLTVDAVLDPVPGAADLDKWVIYVPRENSEAVRAAVFEAGAGHIGDYSHCSWSVAGTGQFLAHDGASPAIGSVGTVERVAEDRVEVVAPARARAEVLAAMRAAHPYEEPAFDIFALVPPPVGSGLGRIGRLPKPEPLRTFVARLEAALPPTATGVRAAGDPDLLVSRVAVCGRRGLVACHRGRRGRASVRYGRSATSSSRRALPSFASGPDRRRALGKRIPVVRPGRRSVAVSFRRVAAGACVHHLHRPVEPRSRNWERSGMKAGVAQQRSLLELAKLDAELTRIAHRATHLPQRAAYQQVQAEHNAANDRMAALRIAAEDLDGQVSRFESEIDAVRKRGDRDRSLLTSGATDAKQLADLQHELDSLQRRQASLEDALLEVLERREELQAQQTAESRALQALRADLAAAQQALDEALAEIDQARHQHSSQRDMLTATLDPELAGLYERQRAGGGPGAGRLQGHRCGACRIEIGRGELAQISAAAEDEVVRCPECGAILLRLEGFEE